MAWTRRELAKAHRAQFPAERLHRDRDAEFLENPLAEIDEPPAHDAVNRRDWTLLDHLGERHPVGVFELRRLAWRLLIDETAGAMGVELHDPVTHNLQCHAADFRSLDARRPLVDRSQSQQAPRLRPVFCLAGYHAQLQCIEIGSERNWHGESPRSPYRIKFAAFRESPTRVIISGNWYNLIPTADGGDGTRETLVDVTKGETYRTMVLGPLREEIDAPFGILGDRKTAAIEMAETSGLRHIEASNRAKDPMTATTYG